jgi:hypothetical protein
VELNLFSQRSLTSQAVWAYSYYPYFSLIKLALKNKDIQPNIFHNPGGNLSGWNKVS